MRMGHTVTIFAASMVHNSEINLITDQSLYREETVDGIPYVYIKTRFYNSNGTDRIRNMFQFARRLPEVCRHFDRPDVIVASSATPPACMAGIKLAKRYDCRGIAEISDLWPEGFVAYGLIDKGNLLLKLMYAYERRMYTKADAIIFTMEGGRDYIIGKGWDTDHGGPVDLRKVYHINNGVDMEVFDSNREHYQIDDCDLDDNSIFKAVYTGSVRLVNNIGVLVGVAECLKKRGSNNIKILIYGDGDERESLCALAKERHLDNIVFKGNVEKKYIPFILSKCDLNLMHYGSTQIVQYGVSLNKSFEYLASGKPILSNIKPNYDYIATNGCGISDNFQTAEEYANAIITFSKMQREQYKNYCNNARKIAEQYDFAKLAGRLLSIIYNGKIYAE